MHEHTSVVVDAGTLLSTAALCSVLAATLVLCRRLAGEWARLHDRATPATHAGMGAVMVYVMVATPTRPVLVVGGTTCVLIAGLYGHRALGRGRTLERFERAHCLATAGTALVMALVLLVVDRGTALTISLLTCLLVCGVIYARSTAGRHRRARQHPSDVPHLAMTAGMLVMVWGV
jgi:hypothetical protein